MWFKVDDGFHDHPKAFDAPDCAIALWTRAGSWAGRNGTDGFVPAGMAARLCEDPERATAELVERGLWHRVKGGFKFHDWTAYQPTRAEAAAVRTSKSIGGKVGNHRRWHVDRGVVDPRCAYCAAGSDTGTDGVPMGGPIPNRSVSGRVPGPLHPDDRGRYGPVSNGGWSDSDRISDRYSDSVTESTRPDPTRPDIGNSPYAATDRRRHRSEEPPANAGPPGEAEQLLTEWKGRLQRPIGSVVAAVGLWIRDALRDGASQADIRETLRRWDAKREKGPGLLPSILHEVVNAPAPSNVVALPGASRPQQSTTDSRVAHALALADRLEQNGGLL